MTRKLILIVMTLALTFNAWGQVEFYDTNDDQTSDIISDILNDYEGWKQGMNHRLDALMEDKLLSTTQLGLLVYDLTTEEVLYQKNDRQLMRPASVMKLVTSITALDILGRNYEYRTSICYNGTMHGDTLRGNLYCLGGFDPTITRSDVAAMADTIYRYGIHRIEGMIVADLSMKDTTTYGSGWCWDDDNDRLSPLLVDKKDRFIPVLAEELRSRGVELSVTYSKGRVPERSTQIYLLSRNISKILQRMMKKSDNLYAESMFYQIAASQGSSPGKASDASGVIKRLVNNMGLDPTLYTFADGSGLSLYDYVSAELIVRLLRYAFQYQEIYQTLYPCLPIAGVDGTLESRMKNSVAQGNVHAKTGTVRGVSTLAGYCRASNGHLLCFAILNQGIVKASDGRGFQDKVCQALCK
jgi:D-alanyl-D-alanine carboxypeptidase/D-alanyl-D-alanine-endopeptidase (penicillin-binding protein 4)